MLPFKLIGCSWRGRSRSLLVQLKIDLVRDLPLTISHLHDTIWEECRNLLHILSLQILVFLPHFAHDATPNAMVIVARVGTRYFLFLV